MRTCEVCQRPHYGLGLCKLHYDRFKRHGDFEDPQIINFWKKVNKTPTCWLWTAATQNGYGVVNQKGKTKRAHRVAYELINGLIPDNLPLDHICRVKLCVRPDHLEPVTQTENNKRTKNIKRGVVLCYWCQKEFETAYPNRKGPRCCGSKECKNKRELYRIKESKQTTKHKF